MRRRDRGGLDGQGSMWLLAVALTVVLSGCGTFSGLAKTDEGPMAGLQASGAPEAEPVQPAPTLAATLVETDNPEAVAAEQPGEICTEDGDTPTLLSQIEETDALQTAPALVDLFAGSALAQRAQESTDAFDEEYDPWEPFNEKMFAFNRGVDRWVFKPAARAYMFVMPEPWQVLISNGFDNINFVPRLVNSLLQGKWGGAGRELSRFLINSTAGVGGLFDPAKDFWGIQKSREDFGQTLGVWGSGPGPYLVLPFMEPLNVRDGIGKAVDGLMDPLSYVLPFIWDRLAMKIGDAINERALNYDLFQGFEESVIDMYSAVRHGYLQRRQQLIKE
ncbi:MAG TPA: VacJ family lipoprotein [Candidatus Acidoferrum sp.]|nr:VacJ family lipoprotein [Candidatus Acidoferrum sp.]